MSPTSRHQPDAFADPTDASPSSRQKRSTPETFGIPLAVLLELTHRCPLQCPLLLQPGRARALRERTDHRRMEEGAERTRRDRRAAGAFLRRRADGAQGPCRADPACHRCRALLQPHHLGGAADARAAERRWPMPGSAISRSASRGTRTRAWPTASPATRDHSKKLEVAGWARELGLPLTVNAVMHRQNLHQLPEHDRHGRGDLDADRHRGGQRAVLRLGA
jgi:pyrroloquinoline quinone biosynthesis protein E